MKKAAVVVAVAGAIAAFPGTAGAQGQSEIAPNCERGQFTAAYHNLANSDQFFKHFIKAFGCMFGTP